jgi:Uma2 family endonuclease
VKQAPEPGWPPISRSRYSAETIPPGEMAAKRRDYFAAGVELVWEIDPDARTVAVYVGVTQVETLGVADTLDGGSVLRGFTLAVQALFAELDRRQ